MDKLVIKSLEMQHLHNLCGSMVDLAYTKVRSRDAVDLGICIISSPAYVFIKAEEKGRFGMYVPIASLLSETTRRNFYAPVSLGKYISSMFCKRQTLAKYTA